MEMRTTSETSPWSQYAASYERTVGGINRALAEPTVESVWHFAPPR